jgi:subtilase family serine protease
MWTRPRPALVVIADPFRSIQESNEQNNELRVP